MLTKIYSVFDTKLGAFRAEMSLLCFETDGLAIRFFSDACRNEKSIFAKHPEDYMFYCVGEFQLDSGTLLPIIPNRLVCRASEFINAGVVNADGR